MPEYVGCKPEAVKSGESVLIENRCEDPIAVGVGLIFREDGTYCVSVRNGKITVWGKQFEKEYDVSLDIIELPEEVTP